MKKFIKVIALVLALSMVVAFAACSDKKNDADPSDVSKAEVSDVAVEDKAMADITVGLICLHDENSTYDKNFIDALNAAADELGFKTMIKTNVGEDEKCAQAAEEFVDAGCDVIFADSFGHESYIMQVAEENPEVEFCHATGTHAKTAEIANFHNAFASIYEGRYAAGVVAGMKLNEMIEEGKITAEEAKIGYVGAFPYAEVKSGYTSFYLGAKSVCPTATMKVTYTNSWFDIGLEKEAALALISDGCVLVSQHADSEGAPKACEEKGVPNVAYNINTQHLGPNTALISSKINWAPYFKLIATAAAEGKDIPADWCGTFATGSVELTELNEKVAAKGTQEKLDEVIKALKDGELNVFDTATFTVKGEKLDTYLADVVPDDKFTPDTNVIFDGYFHESDVEGMRSAPYFDLIIDGVESPN